MAAPTIEKVSQIVGRTGVLRICHKRRLEKPHLLQAIGKAVVGSRRRCLGIRGPSSGTITSLLMEVADRIEQYRDRTIFGLEVGLPKDLDCFCKKAGACMVDCQIQKHLIV